MSLFEKFSILKPIRNSNNIERILFVFGLAVIIIVLANYSKKNKEGFKENFKEDKKFIIKTGSDIYDKFYVSIYDDLLYSSIKNNYEIGQIINTVNPTKKGRILDIGSGTGHHVALLQEMGYDTMGIDISPAMISKAKDTYPSLNFMIGDANNGMLFSSNEFSIINCLYFTIYYIKNKARFFDNCIKWLRPGGHLAIHMVDKDTFDPIIPAGDPLSIISAQTYAKNRIMSTVVDFDSHEYKSKFELQDSNKGVFHETFKNKQNGNIRKNEHEFFMESQKKILALAKSVGFIFVAQIDLGLSQYENQYIYILKKPN